MVTLLTDFHRPSFRIMGGYYRRALQTIGYEVDEIPTPIGGAARAEAEARGLGDLVLHNTLGSAFVPYQGRVNVALPVHEWSRYPSDWSRALNEFQEIWVTTRHVADVLAASGVSVPLYLAPPPLDWEGEWKGVGRAGDPSDAFRFLSVGAGHFRKGHHLLMEGFARAFPNGEGATLTIKTDASCDWRSPAKGVSIVAEEWGRDKIRAVFADSDAYASASLGEGLGLPIVEAILSGLPVVTNCWGGHASLLDRGGFVQIAHRVIEQPFCSRPEFFAPGQQCAYSDPDTIAEALQQVASMSRAQRSEIAATALRAFKSGPYAHERALANLAERMEALGC